MAISVVSNLARSAAFVEYQQARILAVFQFLRLRLFAGSSQLDRFDLLVPSILPERQYGGKQQIPVQQITGSVERSQDYDRSFRPRKRHLQNRWVNCYLLARFGQWSPIRVFKVGEQYFVADGHHRTSVARALRMPFIQAEVWEYQPSSR